MKALITIATIFLLFASCKKDRLTANGDMKTETRNLGTFTGVRASGSNDIHISYGSQYKVELRGSSNLIPYFKTNVVNNKLVLNYGNASVWRDDLEVYVTLPMLKNINLSGSSEVDVNGNFPLINFFNVDISGSGEVKVNNFLAAEELDITVSGSGSADLEKLNSKRADASISGSGDVRVRVEDRLKASISGSGKVYYTGSPVVESNISGSGKLIKF